MTTHARVYPLFTQYIPAQQYRPGLVAQTLHTMGLNNEFIVLDTKRVNIAIVARKPAKHMRVLQTFLFKDGE
jgi:hypothetical protein